jgi:hypothetical protein
MRFAVGCRNETEPRRGRIRALRHHRSVQQTNVGTDDNRLGSALNPRLTSETLTTNPGFSTGRDVSLRWPPRYPGLVGR